MQVNFKEFISDLNHFEESVQRKDIQESNIHELAAPILQGMGNAEQQEVLIRAIYEADQSVATDQKIKNVMKYLSGVMKKRLADFHQHLAPCTVMLDDGQVTLRQELLKKYLKVYRTMKEDIGSEQVEPEQVVFDEITVKQFKKLLIFLEKRELDLNADETLEEWFKIAEYFQISELPETIIDFAENSLKIDLYESDCRIEYHHLAKFARRFHLDAIQRKVDWIASEWFLYCFEELGGLPTDENKFYHEIWTEIRDECVALTIYQPSERRDTDDKYLNNEHLAILKGERLRKLKILNRCKFVNNDGWRHLTQCKKLQKLSILYGDISTDHNYSLKKFSGLNELKSLETPRDCYFDQSGIAHLLRLPNLKSLKCNVNYGGTKNWEKFTNLEQLELRNIEYSKTSLYESLYSLTNLRSLFLENARSIENEQFFKIATKLVLLKSLGVSDSEKLTYKCLLPLTKLENLRSLTLIYSLLLCPKAWQIISRCKHLESLDLSFSRMCKKGIPPLPELKNLRHLNFSVHFRSQSGPIPDDWIENLINACPKIEWINLDSNPVSKGMAMKFRKKGIKVYHLISDKRSNCSQAQKPKKIRSLSRDVAFW